VLTVHPGRYGARFLSSALKKVKQLRKLQPKLDIEVDGGISDKTIRSAKRAGANFFVSGSYLQSAKSPRKSYQKLRRLIQ